MAKTQSGSGEAPERDVSGLNHGSIMNQADKMQRAGKSLVDALTRFHRDESGVAMTEYIIIFTLISFGSTVALLATAAYIKAYRDFMVWWLGHPAV